MARDDRFNKAINIFRKELKEKINAKILEAGEEKTLNLANTFAYVSKNKLNSANPAPESKGLIEEIKNSITVEKIRQKLNEDKKATVGYGIKIPIDKEGLVMFLEYGTGILGENNKHPQTDVLNMDIRGLSFSVWKYAVNKNNYKTVKIRNRYNKLEDKMVPCYITRNGKLGFVFKKHEGKYIDANDEVFFNEPYKTKYSWVKGYTDKNGRVVKPYIRYHKDIRTYNRIQQYVFSQGIKPVRFIYDAKQTVWDMIDKKQI